MSALLIALVAMQATGTIGEQPAPIRQDAPTIQSVPPMPVSAPPPPPPPPPLVTYAPHIPASPRNAPQSWVTNDDYPAAALRAGEAGTAGFELTINTLGDVIACKITSSSGSASLDGATCNLMRLRAKLNPARDERNRPVASIWRSRFRWELPEDTAEPEPLVPATFTTRFTIGRNGAITACTDSSNGPTLPGSEMCDYLRGRPADRLAALRGNAPGPVSFILRGSRTVDGEAPEPYPIPDGFRLVSSNAIAFEVSETGAVENCVDGSRESGACAELGRFIPGPARRTVFEMGEIWTDGDPGIMAAWYKLWEDPPAE